MVQLQTYWDTPTMDRLDQSREAFHNLIAIHAVFEFTSDPSRVKHRRPYHDESYPAFGPSGKVVDQSLVDYPSLSCKSRVKTGHHYAVPKS
jgi:hypothetical protein